MLTEFLLASASLYAILLGRYFLVSGSLYWTLWRLWPLRLERLQKRQPSAQIIRQEILWSLLTSFIFAIPGALLLVLWKHGFTRIYTDVSAHGWIYFGASLALYLFVHDTYFYWTHRWMHRPEVLRRMHYVHHQSSNPTPWAAFSFHPYESILEALIIPALAVVVPIHIAALAIVLSTMTIFGATNHAGYEIFSRSWVRGFFGRHLISATHHNLHHEKFNCNYGLYFRFWDKWMGTDQSLTAVVDFAQPPVQKRPSQYGVEPQT